MRVPLQTVLAFAENRRDLKIRTSVGSAPTMETKKRSVLRRGDPTAMVVDTPGGGPAVSPSGQTYRNAAHLVKMFSVLIPSVSYHLKISPILRWSRQPRSKNQRSPLDVKAPAQFGG